MAGVTVFRQLSRLKGASLTLLKEDIMPSANRMTTPVTIDEALIGGRHARLGGYTVSFETFRQDADPASCGLGAVTLLSDSDALFEIHTSGRARRSTATRGSASGVLLVPRIWWGRMGKYGPQASALCSQRAGREPGWTPRAFLYWTLRDCQA